MLQAYFLTDIDEQGSRVRPIWSHVRPNFSRVRLTKIPGRTGASSHSRKEKKSIRDSETLVQQKTPPLGLYRGLNQSEIVKGGPPLWLAVVQIFLYVCVCVWRCVCCCSQRERWVSRDARSSFSESDLFSECLTVTPGFCDRWIYRKIMQTPLFSKLLQISLLDASCDVIAMRIQSKKGCFSVQKWNEQLCVLFMHDLQELHWTNEPKAEQIRTTRLGYRPFICSDRRRGLLSITRHRYTRRWQIQWRK